MRIMMENFTWNYQFILRNEQKFTLSLVDTYEQNWKKKYFWFIIYIFIPLHGICRKACNYYSILPEVKLIDFSWEFVVVFRESLFWINLLDHVSRFSLCFDLSFLSWSLVILFASCLKVFERFEWYCFGC